MSATKIVSYLKYGWDKFIVGEYSAALPVMADGERAMAQVDAGGRLRVEGKLHRAVSVVPVVDTAQYAANDQMGGKLTFANALRLPSLSGRLMSIDVQCKSVQTNTLKLALFNADPAASTFTNNAQPSIHASDAAKLIGVFTLGAAATLTGSTHTSFQLDNINKAIQAAGTTLYGALISSAGTPTLAVGDLTVTIGVDQD